MSICFSLLAIIASFHILPDTSWPFVLYLCSLFSHAIFSPLIQPHQSFVLLSLPQNPQLHSSHSISSSLHQPLASLLFLHQAISLSLILFFLLPKCLSQCHLSLPLIFTTPLLPPFLSLSLSVSPVCRRWWEYLHQGQINIIPLHTRVRKMHLALPAHTLARRGVDLAVLCCVWGVKMNTLESFSSLLQRCRHKWVYVFAFTSLIPAWLWPDTLVNYWVPVWAEGLRKHRNWDGTNGPARMPDGDVLL